MIKKGSKVKVITGKYKNTVADVVNVDIKKGTVIVEGVNVKKRAIKKTEGSNENFVFLQRPIHISNVVEVETSEKTEEKAPKSAKKVTTKKVKKEKGE